MSALILQTIVLVAAVVIILRTEPALNRMNHGTPFLVRSAFHLLTVGAVSEIVFILAGDVPTGSMAILYAGVAVLLICERRLRVLCPPPKRRAK